MKSWYIYKITNNLNSKAYVGQHYFDGDPIKDSYFGSGIALKKAVKKYGKENFTKEILHYGIETKKRANIAEIFEIWNQFTLSPNGYNLTQGGDGRFGYINSEETKKKMSEAHKGNKNYFYGKKHSEEARKKMSEGQKRRQNIKRI